MNSPRLLSLTTIGLLVLFVSSSGTLAKSPPTDQAFEQMLRGIDTIPSRASMEKRWPNVVERLIAAAKAPNRDNYTRSRAISFMSFFSDNAKVRPTLKSLMGDPKSRVRGIAVYTLARAFGDPGDASLVASIEIGLTDSARDVKTHAIRSLRWVRHASAVRTLKRIAESAPEKPLRTLADRTLKKRRF